MKTVDLVTNLLKIQFPYDPVLVSQVRALPPGRRWDTASHAWLCPPSVDALKQLREWGFEILPAVLEWEKRFLHPSKPTIQPIHDIPRLKHKLYPFQAEGVGFIESRGGRVLVADEMGLGKTIQALAWLQYKGNTTLPAVVVCPASLKGNWERECLEWTTLTPYVLSGRQKINIPDDDLKVAMKKEGLGKIADNTVAVFESCDIRNLEIGSKKYSIGNESISSQRRVEKELKSLSGDMFIINYDILDSWSKLLTMRGIKTVILDECHMVKNSKAKRTKAVKAFCKGKQHVIALSGTPIINRPQEFFTVLNILAPSEFGRYWDYAVRYCDAKHNGYGWDLSGASHTDELFQRIDRVLMLRRLKTEVLKDLPPKTRTTIPLALNGNEGIYLAALREARVSWEDEKPDPLKDITQISALRQAAMDAKYDSCIEWIDNFLEAERKLVLFDIHHKTTDRLMERYGKIAVALDGRTDNRLRSKIVEKFQTDPIIKLLIGNIQVAGTGFTMTAAQDVVFLEFPWTPSELSQAEDRIHRIGQKGAASIYYLVAQGTLEEDMLELIEEKRKVVGAVVDGVVDESKSMIKKLIERIKQKGTGTKK
jgi:SWI/SNF-related matrix-associated actin-dependent regulator 1 of chromatin subfamily A